jgi:hypothetical protein
MAAVALAPIMMATAGHVSPDRVKELAEAAAKLAQDLSKGGADEIPTASAAL